MAIDSARKRKSMLKVAGGFIPVLAFEPSGTVDAQARATLLSLYGGNAFDVPVVSTGTAYNIYGPTGRTIVKKMAFEPTDIRHDNP